MAEDLVVGAVQRARRLFECGAEQVYLAVDDDRFYVTDDPLDRHVIAAVRSARDVERAGEEILSRLR